MKKKLLSILLIALFFFQIVNAAECVLAKEEILNSKIYCTATIDDDFSDDSVIVVINRENSKSNRDFKTSDFKQVEVTSIKNLAKNADVYASGTPKVSACSENNLTLTNSENFRQIIIIEIEKKGKENVLQTIKEIEKLDFVESAEPNYFFYPDDINLEEPDYRETSFEENEEPQALIPNDTSFQSQYALSKINIPNAWEITTGSTAVRVGIIDSGISNHPDLAGNLVSGWDFYNDNGNTADDPTGHGTHVAGIIGAEGNNNAGISGVNWQVSLVPLQVVIDNGSANNSLFSGSAIIEAIDYARINNIPIINCSFGSYRSSYAYETQMQNYGGLIVCSAGNGKDHDNNPNTPKVSVNTDVETHDPSCCPLDNIISVASTDSSDVLADSSNYGTVSVDLAAPGVGILSTYPPAMCSDGTHRSGHVANGYHTMGGTSMAAPHVSGVAALIKSRYPSLTAVQIKAAILDGIDEVSSLSGKCVTGGRLNAKGALDKASLIETTKIVSGDFNGDGKDDLASIVRVGANHTQFLVQISNGTGFGQRTVWLESIAYAASDIDTRIAAGDFNGDGKDDLAVMYNYSGGQIKFYTYLSNGSHFSGSQDWGTWSANISCVDNRFVAGDFNGDGKDDVAVMFRYPSGQVNIFVFLSTGSGFTRQNWYDWSADMTYIEDRLVSGDFNGDSKGDLAVMFRYPSGQVNIFVFLSTGSGFTRQNWYDWSADMTYVGNRLAAGDFNGNGRDDLAVMFGYPSGQVNIFSFMSTENSFTREVWYDWSANMTYVENRFTAGDFNGDDKEDTVVLFQYPSGQVNIFVFLSTGSGFIRQNWYEWSV